jgi:hypothetical protein
MMGRISKEDIMAQCEESVMVYRYYREFVDEPDNPIEMTRAEVADRLIGWVKNTDSAITIMELKPGEQFRFTGFAYYWVEVSNG